MPHVQLRQWQDSDAEPYAALNADPEVMQYFPARLSRAESLASMERQRALIEERGWGLWAVEVEGEFAGFTGLAVPTFEAPFMPCVEIGWRLARPFWGRGVAFAAARQAMHYAFAVLDLPELVSFTVAANQRSRRLMERVGFVHQPHEDFLHPLLPAGHPLQKHVLYRKRR